MCINLFIKLHIFFCCNITNAVLDEIFHFQLAKKGVNVVLISRSEDKLLEVADEIGKIVFCQTEKILNTCTCISLLSLQVKHSHFYKLRVSKEKYKLQSFTGPILAYFQCYFYLDLLVYCIDYDMIAHTFIIFEIYRKREQSANQNHCG